MKRPFFKLAKRSVSLLNTLVSDLDEDEKFEAVNAQVFKTMGALALVLCMSDSGHLFQYCCIYRSIWPRF